MTNNVYVHGSYYGNNYGDVLLVDLFAAKVKEAGFQPVFPFANKFYQEQTGVSIGVKDNAICGIFCGGGYMGESSKGKLKWSIRNYFRHNKAFKLFKKQHLQYGVFGSGFGPLTYNPYKSSAINIIKNSSLTIVRDETSRDYIDEYSTGNDISVAADVVISLTKDDIPDYAGENVEKKWKQLFNNDLIIGVHVTDNFKDNNSFNMIRNAIRDVASHYKNAHIVFLSDGTSRLGKKLKQTVDAESISLLLPENSFSFYSYENHWEMTYFLSKLSLVITSKLHVGIVSTAMNVSVVSIPYHSKTIRYYTQVGAKERCLEQFDTSEQIFEHIRKFVGSAPIVVPENILTSSRRVFVELQKFLKYQAGRYV